MVEKGIGVVNARCTKCGGGIETAKKASNCGESGSDKRCVKVFWGYICVLETISRFTILQ